jgi:hypothetical protein
MLLFKMLNDKQFSDLSLKLTSLILHEEGLQHVHRMKENLFYVYKHIAIIMFMSLFHYVTGPPSNCSQCDGFP